MPRGKRESHWLVIRRCLAIVRRVQRGPACWEELVEAVAPLRKQTIQHRVFLNPW